MKVSRRQLAGIVLASTAVAQAPQVPPKPDAEVEDAKSRQRIAAEMIARVPLPMTTEPAFQFKA